MRCRSMNISVTIAVRSRICARWPNATIRKPVRNVKSWRTRVILTAPNFFCMPSETRKAHAANERSTHAPQTLAQYKASHGPGCGCCSTGKNSSKNAPDKNKPARLVTKTRSGAKGFPTARPWMISH
ncbi:hypothetical protein ACVWXM_003431 [Bradyrhizobium sp. GM7.3]